MNLQGYSLSTFILMILDLLFPFVETYSRAGDQLFLPLKSKSYGNLSFCCCAKMLFLGPLTIVPLCRIPSVPMTNLLYHVPVLVMGTDKLWQGHQWLFNTRSNEMIPNPFVNPNIIWISSVLLLAVTMLVTMLVTARMLITYQKAQLKLH